MRYLEYIYLAWAVAIAAYLGISYQQLSVLALVGLCLAAGLMAFMYSFRRSQRLLLEKMEREQPYPEEEDEDEEASEGDPLDIENKEAQDGH